ncbi:hypothetical protein ACF09J_35840 [Streptomyces sp. NPDC014889]|uniref:hypothetical protein n=1 Tax=Streptomyces sp. NPDC014889 TaxID=3364928 RepID=UPI0036FEA3FA
MPYRLVVDTSRDVSLNYGVETDANGYAHRNTDLTVTSSTINGAVDADTSTAATCRFISMPSQTLVRRLRRPELTHGKAILALRELDRTGVRRGCAAGL